ncbi:MAG TPA: Shedu anti-phage system protein SduA domain-containing protein [Actinomycetota bacterium]|nr:Shedu anti-phage system protein SduA domain-containing protein [Actinomycetota bacterium]
MAERDFAPALPLLDDDGYQVAEVAVCRPRSILVVGSLTEFLKASSLNRPRYESFERFRRSLRDPEIITFDELYERARLMLELAADSTGTAG